METAPLRSFATWARTELITQVSARIAAVLAPASPERTENPRAIRALETDIAKAGGDAKGKDAVADKVAYTWFNRIIALRFMDANGYTNVGVVSPAAGQTVGQPEVLADAKRGTFDPHVVNAKIAKDVTGLLDGTRSSTDPQGEAYTLLLAEYSRYWNKSMPFMFEREGDYTELLIPSNLLADESILARAVSTMTSAVCEDVEVIGWLYQFYISERKDEVFAGFKKNKKAGAAEIPAATQLFTPHWIVRYLVENSVGRLWMLNHPESRLVDQMDYYIAPVDEETDFLKLAGPEELTVIDPACGSGHMLTYAFDLLYAIYEEEGYAPSEIPELILTTNLYGSEIDPRAGALAAFALAMKARAKQRTFLYKLVELNICVIEPIQLGPDELECLLTNDGDRQAEEAFWNQFSNADTLGSLTRPQADSIGRFRAVLGAKTQAQPDLLLSATLDRAHTVTRQADHLSTRFSVTVANPPYMGSKQMPDSLLDLGKNYYPSSKRDLYSMFLERYLGLTLPGGCVAMITMHSWMFTSSYELLREKIITSAHIACMAHLGAGAFDSIAGEVVATTAFVIQCAPAGSVHGIFDRLLAARGEHGKSTSLLSASNRYSASSDDLEMLPGKQIAYWLSPAVRQVFSNANLLGDVATLRQGLATGDNDRFLRHWWEVSLSNIGVGLTSVDEALGSGKRWFPHNKGGAFRKWYGNQDHVIAFSPADYSQLSKLGNHLPSRQFYFMPSVSWSQVSSGEPAFRTFPAGFVFDVGGNSALHPDSDLRSEILAIGNSSVGTALLAAIAPTMNFVVGDVARLPVRRAADSTELLDIVGRLVFRAARDWNDFETSRSFTVPSWVQDRAVGIDLRVAIERWSAHQRATSEEQRLDEAENNRLVAAAYGLEEETQTNVELSRVSLSRNVQFRYGPTKSAEECAALERRDVVSELISYAVGCMFGRYSLDVPGLILADQGSALHDYLSKVPQSTFVPDVDNVLPIVDGEWFEDDIVARFREFLRAAFGETHFEENLRFVEESLGVKTLRDYFITRGGKSKFYEDHVKRYKKRPIYWMFSSPKGSFNALIYMHRYNPSTVSTVLNDYLREYEAKLEASLHNLEREANGDSTPRQQAAAAKEVERLRKILVELSEYEHEVMYPLASEQIAIDLDDGVKSNYPKFGSALKKIPGLRENE